MIFGHNTNLKHGNITFHVQTEDRGEAHGLIDTTVYYLGRVLHRRTNSYADLLPMNEDRLEALKLRLDDQHHTVIEEIRSGALYLAIPAPTGSLQSVAPQAPVTSAPEKAPNEPRKLVLELVNAKSWLSGRQARLQVLVQENGAPAVGIQVKASVEGSDGDESYTGQTSMQGLVLIEFDLPRITSPEAALMIRAQDRDAEGHLRFALRVKPRVPSV
jgi:hypothetical protein